MRFFRVAALVAVWLHSAASAQVLINIAGTGTAGFNGDDPLHTAATAQLNVPAGVAVDSAGNLYIADSSNHRVRKVTPAGVITTIAGDGNPLGPLAVPTAVAVDAAGNVYIADTFNHRIRKVAAGTGAITTIAGTGSQGVGADNIAGTASALAYPYGVAVDGNGNVFIADTQNHRIRMLSPAGTIVTVAGNGTRGCSATQLDGPRGLFSVPGQLFIADTGNNRIVTHVNSMSLFAGAADCSPGATEGAATSAAKFNAPNAVSVTASNDVLVADNNNNRIRRIRLGTVSTVAGGGSSTGCAAATSVALTGPLGVATIPGAGEAFYLSNSASDRVQKVAVGAPCAPTLDSAGGGSGQTSLAFTPGYDGGSAVTAFNASCTPGPLTGTNTASPILVTGMTNGTQYSCTVTATNANGTSPASNALQVTPGSASLSFSTTTVDFGGQSMGTTSAAQTITLTNNGGTAVTVSSITVPNSQFAATHNCTNVASGATCTISATFSPAPQVLVPLGGTAIVTTNISIASNATGSPHSVSLGGSAEKSLVTHYYRSILRRAPDTAGKSFWNGEAQRLAALPANVNEAWFAMAQGFYNSAEYLGFNRTQAEFVTDLYNTFFNRPPDSGGLNFWIGEMAAGMPREIVLVSFMFSTEFANFTTAIFGTSTVRPERDMVMDFYRGLLARLPDDAGFNFWVNRFKTAQCNGSAAVTAEANQMSSDFILSAEYVGRSRTNTQFVGDMYNAFLRRGGDNGGVQFWINELNSNTRTREQVRQAFRDSAEFAGRVTAVINAGCQTGG